MSGLAGHPLFRATPPRRKGNKTLLTGTASFVAGLTVASVAATEIIAYKLGFHPALGLPITGTFYAPWKWFEWQRAFYHSSPMTFYYADGMLIGLGALSLPAPFIAHALRRRTPEQHEGVHGTAAFANSEDTVRATGLLPAKGKEGAGVYCGGWKDSKGNLHYLRHSGPEHVLVIAPTRSGKGVGLVLPTLLSHPASCVVNDMKGELWEQTAGWRKEVANNIVLKFDPAAEFGSCGYNALEEVRLETVNEVGDMQNLVTIMVDPEGKGLVDHWAKTAHAFLTGVGLHLLYARKRASQPTPGLSDMALALSDPARPVSDLYNDMLGNHHVQHNAGTGGVTTETHAVVAAAARDMLNRPDEERGSVLSTAMSFLSLYRDPLVARNTSRSNFRIQDLMNAGDPVSLYLVVRPADKDRLRPLMRLVLNQIMRGLTRAEMVFDENNLSLMPHKHRMLMLMDEFPSFGKLEVFEESLAFVAGYGIRCYLIIQDFNQLWQRYGREEAISSNCHVRIAYAPTRLETAEQISRMTGTMTVVKEDTSISGHRFGGALGNVTKAFHEISRPLLTIDEVMGLKAPIKDGKGLITEAGDMLTFVAGHRPIYGTQTLYFLDPVFTERARRRAPPSDSLHGPLPGAGVVRPKHRPPFVAS